MLIGISWLVDGMADSGSKSPAFVAVRVYHGYGKTCGVSKTGNAVTGTVWEFHNHGHTTPITVVLWYHMGFSYLNISHHIMWYFIGELHSFIIFNLLF